jgi:protein SCO1
VTGPARRSVSARALAIGALALFVAVGAGGALLAARRTTSEAPLRPVGASSPYRGSEPPVRERLPSFTLRDHTGATVRAEDLRRGVLVLTFLDSQCTESCPIIASVTARALESLEPRERARVQAVAITTDPAEDTPASVRSFLGRRRALGKLRYLVASERTLQPVWRSFHVLSSAETGEDTLHSAPVRIYRDGVWVATLHAGADLTRINLVHDIRAALVEARR